MTEDEINSRILLLDNPFIKGWIDRQLASSYEDFIRILYRDLENVLSKVQERKQIYGHASEDEITMYIVDLLQEKDYWAVHDEKLGGHVDIIVRRRDTNYLWAAEAKRDKGPDWIEDGFRQLTQRYSTGAENQDRGCILVYVQGKNAKRIFQNWRTHLETLAEGDDFEELTTSDCPVKKDLAFLSTHSHESSGRTYHVRHLAVGLHHNPTV